MNRRVLPLICLLLAVIMILPTSIAMAFADTNSHWSSEYVNILTERKLINGYEDNTFRPDSDITRAEFYKIINSMSQYKKTYTVSFSDINPTDWYHEEVAKGIKAGYIIPTTGKLNPNKPITREEVAEVLGRVYNLNSRPGALERFVDKNSIKKSAQGPMGALVERGIISGYEDGTIEPKLPITRGEISKVLVLAMDKLGKPQAKSLADAEIKFGPRNLYE